jgi:hypothetical protein
MKKIKIVGIPPGEAPEWVRKEWVGLELPLAKRTDSPVVTYGVLSGSPSNEGGYAVKAYEAFMILEKKSPRAHQWWKISPYYGIMDFLVFKKDVCELIS